MSESYVQLPADGAGKKLRSIEKTVGANDVHHEVLVLADAGGSIIGSGGDPYVVKISGEAVVIESGQTVQLPSTQQVQVSGQGVFLPDTQVVKTSGEWGQVHVLSGELTLPSTQVVKISGEQVAIESGQTIQLPSTQQVQISGQGIFLPSTQVVKVSGEWFEVHVLSGEVTLPSTQQVQVSGQGVFLPDTQVVKVSGEKFYPITLSGDYVSITGDITATSNISGQWVEAHMLSGDVSSNVSGQWLEVHMLSGDITTTSNVSGQWLEVHMLSGDITTTSNISGQWVETHILSGEVTLPSTQQVQISGQGTFLPSTQVVKTSGEWAEAHILSGEVTTSISGQWVTLASGIITIQDNAVVKISGETIDVEVPTLVKTGGILLLDDNSGGIVLNSGAVKSVVMKAMNENSGIIFIGGSGVNRPYSGYGLMLEAGDGMNLDVNNFDAVYAMTSISGYATISFAGVQ